MPGLLDGLRVLDFTQVVSGPTVTRYLAELGAEVIKIEAPPRGDLGRATATVKDGRSGFFVSVNRGKRSLCIDLKNAEGLAIVQDLVPTADILVENFSPGAIARLGLGWDVLHELNPRLVMCSISGFGQEGPLSHLPGYDGAAQAYAGITSMVGDIGGPPLAGGAAVGDVMTGVNGVAAILGALYWRERHGEGQQVVVSVLDAYMQAHDTSLQSYSLTDGEFVQTRNGRFHLIATPYGIFEAADGYIFITAAGDGHWTDLRVAMADPDIGDDHRWNDRSTRQAEKEQVNARIEGWLATFASRDAAVAHLQKFRVPAAPVLSIDEVVQHEALRASGSVTTATDPVFGTLDVPGFPLHFSAADVGTDAEAPFLGEHNREVLVDILGSDPDRYDALVADGVLRAEPIAPRSSRQRPIIR